MQQEQCTATAVLVAVAASRRGGAGETTIMWTGKTPFLLLAQFMTRTRNSTAK